MRKLIFLLLIVGFACSVVPITGRKQFIAIPAEQILTLSAETDHCMPFPWRKVRMK